MPEQRNDRETSVEAIRADLRDGAFSRALKAIGDLPEHQGKDPELWSLKARSLQGLWRFEEAVATYRQALERCDRHPRLLLQLGNLYTRLGCGEEAVACFEEALQRAPALIDAYRGLLNFRPIVPDSLAARRLVILSQDKRRPVAIRTSAFFLLGEIHVDAGMDERGFEFYQVANRLVLESGKAGKYEYRVSPNAAAMTAEFFRRHARMQRAQPPCPALIVAGLARSGKSLVEKLLTEHPHISAGGELALARSLATHLEHGADLESVAAWVVRQTESPLAQWCPPVPGTEGTQLIDTSPANLGRLGYLGLLHPEAPIVFCRRDAMDLGVSLYFKNFRSGHLFSNDLARTGRAVALAEKVMDHWLTALPNPIVDVAYETLVRDPQGVQSRMIERLGFEPLSAKQDTESKENYWRLFPSRSADTVGTISPELIGFAKRFSRHLEPMAKAYTEEMARPGLAGAQ
ncbi:MAG: sulfotransferase [Pseudohongiellaceae bacterium]